MPMTNGDGAPSRLKVAVDAMGGDHGPRVVVEGAVAAVREFGAAVILVGDRSAIHRQGVRLEGESLALEIRAASQVVGMAESPSQALRRKRDSSLRGAAELVKGGTASAFISAGNTGAAMAIAMFVIGVLPGVDRPAIAAVVPNLKRFTVLLDVGANVDPKPAHLMQFAVMGHVYARDILGFDNPRVGLLSVGEEEGKGNELTKETYEQLKESSLNFLGNVEGRDIYNGRCDVVVTDGFTGNVALKISESLAEMFGAMIREELNRDTRSKVGAALAVPAFQRFKRRIDYTEMGGAPLLERANLVPEDINFIVVGTTTPDMFFPSTGNIVQHRLGCRRVGSVDVLAACAASIYSLIIGARFIEAGKYRRVLCIGAETLSRITDFTDRGTCVLLADAAGAAVLEATEDGSGFLDGDLYSDGQYWDLLYMPAGGSRMPATAETVAQRQHYAKMKGSEVFKVAVRMFVESTSALLDRHGVTAQDVDSFIPHQANLRTIEAAAKRVGLPMEKVFVNVDRYGNTGAASVYVALEEAVATGRVKRGDLMLIAAFGGGFAWGAALVRW